MHISHPLKGKPRKFVVLAGAAGTLLAGGTAFAATSLWTVGLSANSSGAGQGAPVPSAVSIVGAACPNSFTCNLAYPNATGDAVVTITNTNPYPVTITQVTLPQLTGANEYAQGFTTLTGTSFSGSQSTCSSSSTTNSSLVSWKGQLSTGTVQETLSTAVTVGASSSVTVILTSDLAMGTNAPAACEGLFYQLPSLSSITATEVAGNTATTTGTTTGW
jgi:hypothetical protein